MHNLQYDAPFYRKNDDSEKKDKDIRLTVRLNQKEQLMLTEVKHALEQPKDSTAIKTMFYLAYYNVIQDQKTKYLLATLFKNKRNNERTGALIE